MTFAKLMITKKFILQVLAMLAVTALVLGVCADCSGEGGMYQGGGDSAPSWRK